MISESLRPAGQEALESRVEFLPGATYSTPEGLPGFPEAKEFTVHHVEEVAERKIVWFSGFEHSLDYSILAPHEYAKLAAGTPTETGPTPDRTAFTELLSNDPKKTVKIDLSEFSTQDQQDIRTLIEGLRKQKLLTVSTALYGREDLLEGQTLASFEPQQETDAAEENPGKINHNDSELLHFTLGLLESAKDPATAASLGKLLRVLVARQKKYERRIEVVPSELQPLHKHIANPFSQAGVKAWAESYVRSGYHYLGSDLSQDIAYAAQCLEESPTQIITTDSLLPQTKGHATPETIHTHPGVNRKGPGARQFDLEVKQLVNNLRLQHHQATVGAFESATFHNPQLKHIFFNNPESGQKARTLQDTEAFGSLAVGFIGVDNNRQPGQPRAPHKKIQASLIDRLKLSKKPGTVTSQPKEAPLAPIRYNKGIGRELIGIGGPETEIVFHFAAPKPGGEENYAEAIPFAVEILCPATRTAEEIQEFLLGHPDPETAQFFQQISQNDGMQCTGSHYLRIQTSPTLNRALAAKDMASLSPAKLKTQRDLLNPANLLMMLGALDPESASEPDLYKDFVESSTFREGARRTPTQS